MNYLSPQEMLYIHHRLTKEMGGLQGIHDVSVLKKLAKYMHNNEFFPDAYAKAGALLFGIAKKDPFNDQNQPSALILTKMFLLLNGVELDINQNTINFFKNNLPTASVEDVQKFIVENSN